MSYRSRPTPPERHDHAGQMTWLHPYCWCRDCGQTWKLLDRGWLPLSLAEASFGERRYGD